MMFNPFVSTFILSLIVQLLFFIYAAAFKTDKVTDLSYGLTFIILAICTFLTHSLFQPIQLLVLILVSLWGVRLAGYLFIRILKTKRDKRFDGIRENFTKFAQFWFFQAIAVWVISLPAIYIISFKHPLSPSLSTFIGSILFLFGLGIETIADWQKFIFKNNPKNKNDFISHGIWKYSRHPNYFGEMLVWWGIFVITIQIQNVSSLFTLAGPLFISYILLYVTGIPTLEKKYQTRYKNNKKYQAYKKSTSLLIPFPPKQ